MVQPPPSTDFADVRRLVSSGAPPALIVSDPAWKRMLEEIDAGLARRKETIDRVAADLGVMLEDHHKQRASQPQGHNGGWWPQDPSMGYPGQPGHPPYGPPGYHYPPRGPPYGMPSPPAMPVPPPFPTPPPGYNHPYDHQSDDQETELQRRKRQALQRMSSATPGQQHSTGAEAGYGPPPDPSDKEAFEAYRRACWLKYYQHMAALQTPGQGSDQPEDRRAAPPSSSTVPMPQEDDEDDDINKELLGL
ncbi:hypothetical protein FOL47_004077 [Perkinsus chesapeaki]|uniref:Uncharacterized protein n=1 Tax=Perkinsus chesapeaki TaxID=330153 RepID=A0A7J6M4W9_PERCH|nr:hypothetical protein FOL47_004077 [Perkinsus chesapeaki]